MPVLIYIHGFLSSPRSEKAQQTLAWLQRYRPEWHFECPFLSPHPSLALAALEDLVHVHHQDKIHLIGSSLGGFWATYLTEKYRIPSILINPAVSPQKRVAQLVGQTLKNYHTGEEFYLTQEDLEELAACDPKELQNTDLYWLMVQTGDATLDYRDAVAKYQGCRQTVEPDGNHSFEGYEFWINDIVAFFEQIEIPA
jgi:uncharacterized protein